MLLSLYARSDLPALAGFSFDSFRYLAGAESLLAGAGYRDLSGAWSLHWPPGLSLALATISGMTGRAPEQLFRGLQCLAFVTSGLALSSIFSQLDVRPVTSGAAMACLLLNRHFLSTHSLLWSEPWGVAFALVSIAVGLKALAAGPRSVGLAAAAGAMAGLAVSFRWAMVAVALAGVSSCWAAQPTRRGLRVAASYGVSVALTIVAVIQGTNPGTPMKQWSFDGRSRALPAMSNLRDLADQLVPVRLLDGVPAFGVLLLLFVLSVVGGLQGVTRARRAMAAARMQDAQTSGRPSEEVRNAAAILLSATSGAYCALFLLAPLSNATAQPVLRITFPLLLFLVPSGLLALHQGRTFLVGRGLLRGAAAAVVSVGILLGAIRGGRGVWDRLGDLRRDESVARPAAFADAVGATVSDLRSISAARPEGECLITNASGLGWYSSRRRTLDLASAGRELEAVCGSSPALVAFLRPVRGELERFLEYSGPLSCSSVAGACATAGSLGQWEIASVPVRDIVSALHRGLRERSVRGGRAGGRALRASVLRDAPEADDEADGDDSSTGMGDR